MRLQGANAIKRERKRERKLKNLAIDFQNKRIIIIHLEGSKVKRSFLQKEAEVWS